MPQFILYNYQFTRIENHPGADLFGGMPIQMTAEEAFCVPWRLDTLQHPATNPLLPAQTL